MKKSNIEKEINEYVSNHSFRDKEHYNQYKDELEKRIELKQNELKSSVDKKIKYEESRIDWFFFSIASLLSLSVLLFVCITEIEFNPFRMILISQDYGFYLLVSIALFIFSIWAVILHCVSDFDFNKRFFLPVIGMFYFNTDSKIKNKRESLKKIKKERFLLSKINI